MENKGLIFTAIPAIMLEMDAVAKSRQSTGAGANYKYRSIDQVYNALQKLMGKHGVFTVPKRIGRTDSIVTTANGYEMKHCVITFEYTIFASDGSFVVSVVDGEGQDNSDKVSGKCASYAHKYLLLQLFSIPTEDADDPDAVTHAPTIGANAPKQSVVNHAPGADNGAALSAYRITFGKYKGKTMDEVGPADIANYCEYIERKAKEDGKDIKGNVAEFLTLADSYLAGCDGTPKFDSDEEMPF